MKKYTIFLVFGLLLLNCKEGGKDGTSVAESDMVEKQHPGKRIMEQECYICHNPKTSQESMIAPPMVTIKKYYIGENTTKEQFTEDLIKWVNDPEQESKMPDALFEFGSMPYIPYPDDVIGQIAEYFWNLS